MRKPILIRLADIFRWKRRSSSVPSEPVPISGELVRKQDDAWLLEPERDLRSCRDEHRVEMQMFATGLQGMRHRLSDLAARESEGMLWQSSSIGSPAPDEHDLFDGSDMPAMTVQDTIIGGAEDFLFDALEAPADSARYAA